MTIEHIAVYVRDLEQSTSFFETYFNGKRGELYHNKRTGFSSYFISFDNSARLELMTLPTVSNKRPAMHIGYAHIAFNVGSKEKVNELTARLEKDGYRVKSYPRTTGDGYYESCVYDSEGNEIEITA